MIKLSKLYEDKLYLFGIVMESRRAGFITSRQQNFFIDY